VSAVDDPSRKEDPDDGLGAFVRRMLSTGPPPEERLEGLLAERRRELDETAAQFDASVAELERREDLLRDSRASVERMLRLGKNQLEARESELTSFQHELSKREARVSEAEAELAQRRQELGAVELKRATLERREEELEERERELGARERRVDERESHTVDVPAGTPAADGQSEVIRLAFVPAARYGLVDVDLPAATRGSTVELEGEEYVVSRLGPSPLPGDARRCAYLTRGTLPPARGSS